MAWLVASYESSEVLSSACSEPCVTGQYHHASVEKLLKLLHHYVQQADTAQVAHQARLQNQWQAERASVAPLP